MMRYVALLAPAALALSGCNRDAAGGNSERSPQTALVPVTVARVVAQDVPVQVQAIGWAEAYATVTVKARVDGQLVSVHFKKGQDVHLGDLLFNVDPKPFEASVHLAAAHLARDKALAEDAAKDAQWKDELLRQNSAAQRERDQSMAQAESLRATVRADEAALETAQLQLGWCTINSPIEGRAGDLLVDVGNMVKANDTALVVIDQVRPIYVAFSVPEQHLPAIKKHMGRGDIPVEAAIPQDAGPPERGVLTFMDNRVDNTTGTIRLKGTFQNEHRRLWPGQFLNVTLTLESEHNATVVPTEAVQTGQKGQFVFVVKDDRTVDYRPVTIGRVVEHRTVIQEGVRPGEVVVTDGQLRLVPGTKVEIKNQPTTTKATSK
jgi:multidrug efflux system membrane fusion protein